MDYSACPQPGCDLPAEIFDRVLIDSTHQPVEHARLLCVAGHRFLMPTEMLPINALPVPVLSTRPRPPRP